MVLWLRSDNPSELEYLDGIIKDYRKEDVTRHDAAETQRHYTGDPERLLRIADFAMQQGIAVDFFTNRKSENEIEDLRAISDGDRLRSVFAYEGLRFRYGSRFASIDDREVQFSVKEYALLELLINNSGETVSSANLIEKVFGNEQYAQHDNHNLGVLMSRLRKKFPDDAAQPRYLFTDRGEGYRFGPRLPDFFSEKGS